MRPALQRLLNRPTSLAVLDAVVTSRVDLIHLRSFDRCPRCYVHGLSTKPEPLVSGGANEEVTNREHHGRGGAKRKQDEGITYSKDHAKASTVAFQSRKRELQPQIGTADSSNARVPRSQSGVSNFFSRKRGNNTSGIRGKDLDFESDVGHSRDIGSKLIDNPKFAEDYDLWEELLLYGQRVYGDDGVIDIWRGLRERAGGIDLPIEKKQARLFWETFIGVGLRNEEFLDEIYSYARQLIETSGKRWTRFYSTIVGGFIETDLKKAIRWHELLKDDHLPLPNAVLGVFRQARTSKDGLWAFRKILMTIEGHQVYHSVIPMLVAHKRFQEALSMHQFLISRNDWPRDVGDIEPLIQCLEQCGSKEEERKFWNEVISLGIMQDQQKVADRPPSRDSTGSSDQPVVKEKRFTDEFGARLFATKAFTFELLLGGLKVFGVEAIGPLTLREMAIRAGSAEEVEKQIALMRQAKISVGNSVFTRVVQKLVSERDERTLHDVLHSDQHPEVLEDPDMQEILLGAYYEAQDWRQIKKTLAILREFSDEDPHAFNIHFRRAIRLRDRGACSSIIEEMREHGLAPSLKSARLVLERFLPPRRKGFRPRLYPGMFDDLMFLVRTFQRIVHAGGEVPPEYWFEGFRQLGMTDRWDEFSKLCLWFAHFYSRGCGVSAESETAPWNATATPMNGTSARSELLAAHPKSPLRVIFCVPMQRAIIAWGFKRRLVADTKSIPNPFSKTSDRLIPWVRGIVLLRQLRAKGVIIQTLTVRRACRHRLAILFGAHRPSEQKANRTLRRENPYSLERVLADIDKAWGRPLFGNFEESRHRLVNPPSRPQWKRRLRLQRKIATRLMSAAHA